MDDLPKLSKKQQLFVERYLIHRNATKAYKEAGYDCKGKVAQSAASRMLAHVKVKAHIEAGAKEITRRNGVTQDWVMQRLMKIADSRMSKVAEADGGRIRLKEDMTEEEIDSLDSYSYSSSSGPETYSQSVKWKVKDPTAALKMIGDYLGMWEKDKKDGTEKEDPESIKAGLDQFLERFG